MRYYLIGIKSGYKTKTINYKANFNGIVIALVITDGYSEKIVQLSKHTK